MTRIEQGPTLVPAVIRNDGTTTAVVSPGIQAPYDVVLLSQNQYLRALLTNAPPTPFDLYLTKSNQASEKAAARLASQIASMPEVPDNVKSERTLRTEGAKLFKAAQLYTSFQQTNKLLENMNKSADQIIRGMVLDLIG
ncbi:MAG: hypothetical protein KF805_11565 [Phycisphaeraceae bacterium]|nr:hypothetical protein [Phycisphaeraceae bacterium]